MVSKAMAIYLDIKYIPNNCKAKLAPKMLAFQAREWLDEKLNQMKPQLTALTATL